MHRNLIFISAIWCTSCLIVSNNLKQIINEFPNLHIINLDYDLDEEKFSKYNIGTTLPVIILEDDNGNEVNRLIGERTVTEIRDFLNNN